MHVSISKSHRQAPIGLILTNKNVGEKQNSFEDQIHPNNCITISQTTDDRRNEVIQSNIKTKIKNKILLTSSFIFCGSCTFVLM